MTNAVSHPTRGGGDLVALRRKIGWICRALQFLVVGYTLWILWLTYAYWGDRAFVEKHCLDRFGLDISAASEGQFALSLFVHFIVWALLAAMCFCLWRVLALYLEGRVFTVDSALWLRRAGLLGIVTTLADFASRSVVLCVLAAHLPSTADKHHGFITSDDPLHLMLALIVVAFAHIQKAGAEIADENAQIV